MLRSLLGMLLMGVGFPKCYLTERKRPRPAVHAHDPEASWTHNIKDDFTDDVMADKEFWIKFMGFWLLVFMALSVVFSVAVCVQIIVL